MKVYAVYGIPKSPEYTLKGLFLTKSLAKSFIKQSQNYDTNNPEQRKTIYDLQVEWVNENEESVI